MGFSVVTENLPTLSPLLYIPPYFLSVNLVTFSAAMRPEVMEKPMALAESSAQ
jgi:hypothetical protein